ncbi:MAG TPA: nucleoside hydrolase [Anaerolineae bacterium]|mgnify:CR=1 FL=1|nr:nucleoside hydrolase [Anaerolineae bacterium]HQH37231.1 nucleoside hydrolase [Anaerolineae bacterium]
MQFPVISEAERITRLQPPTGKVQMVLDTDTYNEVDDQFAIVQALLSPEKLEVLALYAAPFFNDRSTGPADGMEKSYEEILRLLARLDVPSAGLVFRGSEHYLPDGDHPVESAAAYDLVAKALARRESDDPLYVVAIGAITNVASALLLAPEIIRRIVVVWLGGHAFHWPDTREFNMWQDPPASRVILDSGVPLVQIPVMGVCSHLHTTIPEIERYVARRGAIGDYLAETVKSYHADHFAWSKVIWDIAAVSYLLDESWTPTHLVHSPILTAQGTWSFDNGRHLIRSAYHVQRDPIFRDVFKKLEMRNKQEIRNEK